MIDGKTLYEYWDSERSRIEVSARSPWSDLHYDYQRAWEAFAGRIKAEMGRPPIVPEGTLTEEDIEEFFRPGAVIQQKMPVQRVPGELREKVYDASKKWWLTQLGFANPADDAETEKIKKISEAAFMDAVKNSMVASASASNEYSTHHKSCALRHDGITCTCS